MAEGLSKEIVEGTRAKYGDKIKDVDDGDPTEYQKLGKGAVPVLGSVGGVVVPRTSDYGGVAKADGVSKYGMDIPIFEVGVPDDDGEGGFTKQVGTLSENSRAREKKSSTEPAEVSETVKRTRELDAFEAEPAMGVAPFPSEEPPGRRDSLVSVTMTGDFGSATVKALTAFREGGLIVVVTDPDVGFSFTPPASMEGRFTVKVKDPAGDNWTAKAAFAGVAYDMPDGETRHMVFAEAGDHA